MTYRDVIHDNYQIFNVMKTEMWEQVKRIKAIKLFPGKIIGSSKDQTKQDVLGGIQIVYELKN